VARVANPDVPVPYSHPLEYAILPRHDRIEAALHRVTRA
jgi:pyruvate dehydrogenase E1 component beta subunit